MSRLPLAGMRVLDFCWVGAGSYMTKLLADLGADVVKVESSRSLDSLRLAAPFAGGVRGVNRSGYFADRNSSKRSITIDMKDPRGVEIALALVREADVVANNFRPGTMEKLGVGYDALRAINPGIVFIGMSMNGDEGPDRMMLGYGITMAAMTGFLGNSGYQDRPPTGTGTNYPDHVPNPTHGAFAVLAAVRHRRRTGEGQKIDMAQTEPMLALMPIPTMDFQANGRATGRRGNALPGVAPRGVYPTLGRDRWIAISVASDEQWLRAVEVLGHAMATPARATAAGRAADAEALDAALAAATSRWDGYELMSALQARAVPSGVVQDASDLLDRDPQLAHRGHWHYLPHAEMGTSVYNGLPFHLSSGPAGPRRAAPLLGEHTRELLVGELGMSVGAVDRLETERVLA